MTTDNKPKSNPKLDKFLDEINKVGTKYQYKIVPVLRVGPEGIFPGIQIVDVVPPDTNKKDINGNGTIPDIGKK